jgi:hypothetical protein
MARTLETPLQAKSLAPRFTVDDLQESIRFFEYSTSPLNGAVVPDGPTDSSSSDGQIGRLGQLLH